jgi:hypothetical protein
MIACPPFDSLGVRYHGLGVREVTQRAGLLRDLATAGAQVNALVDDVARLVFAVSQPLSRTLNPSKHFRPALQRLHAETAVLPPEEDGGSAVDSQANSTLLHRKHIASHTIQSPAKSKRYGDY